MGSVAFEALGFSSRCLGALRGVSYFAKYDIVLFAERDVADISLEGCNLKPAKSHFGCAFEMSNS